MTIVPIVSWSCMYIYMKNISIDISLIILYPIIIIYPIMAHCIRIPYICIYIHTYRHSSIPLYVLGHYTPLYIPLYIPLHIPLHITIYIYTITSYYTTIPLYIYIVLIYPLHGASHLVNGLYPSVIYDL